jgi:hypothetical protein
MTDVEFEEVMCVIEEVLYRLSRAFFEGRTDVPLHRDPSSASANFLVGFYRRAAFKKGYKSTMTQNQFLKYVQDDLRSYLGNTGVQGAFVSHFKWHTNYILRENKFHKDIVTPQTPQGSCFKRN